MCVFRIKCFAADFNLGQNCAALSIWLSRDDKLKQSLLGPSEKLASAVNIAVCQAPISDEKGPASFPEGIQMDQGDKPLREARVCGWPTCLSRNSGWGGAGRGRHGELCPSQALATWLRPKATWP